MDIRKINFGHKSAKRYQLFLYINEDNKRKVDINAKNK